MNTPHSSRGDSRGGTRSTRGRGRGRGSGSGSGSGSGRGYAHNNNNNRQPHSSQEQIPRIAVLTPGTPVSIVLKMDQGSGREVRGFVGELLTRGDHPRGVKVRLRDGRVGRVQRLCTEEEAVVGESGRRGLGENGEGDDSSRMSTGMNEKGGVRAEEKSNTFPLKTYTDFRNDGYDESSAVSTAGASLEDYIVVKGNQRGKGKGKKNRERIDGDEGGKGEEENKESKNGEVGEERSEQIFKSVLSICPVCGEFEGDEVAVAHHVNGHFE